MSFQAVGNFFSDLTSSVGPYEAVVILCFFGAHYVIYRLYKGRLEDRQREIDRIASDNREYRDRFLQLMDDAFSYSPPSRKVIERPGSSQNSRGQ